MPDAVDSSSEERQKRPEGARPEVSSERSETLRNRSVSKTDDEPAKPEQKPGILAKIGLDVPTISMMFKGSLPPIICISIYQANSISSIAPTLGYLMPIISVLSLAILPRGKYMQNLLLNTMMACIGAAIAMLVLWSAVQARAHTSNLADVPAAVQATGRPPYNSSQSAVCGVWLFANIWFVNVLRAKMPSFNLPVILYSIMVNVSATFGTIMVTTAQAEAFVKQLLTIVLMGIAFATGVSFFIFPVSSRMVVTGEMKGLLGLFRKAVMLQKEYLQGLEREDMFALELTETAAGPKFKQQKKKKQKCKDKDGHDDEELVLTKEAKSAQALRETISQIRELAGKLHGDMKFAKRDTAWGKLAAHDLGEIFGLMRKILIPITGLSTIMDIFKRVADTRGWNNADPDTPIEVLAAKEKEQRVWNEVMRQLHEPFDILSQAIDQGLEHAGIVLEFLPRPKEQKKAAAQTSDRSQPDVEAQGDDVRPGQPDFVKVMDEKVRLFHSKRGEILGTWAREKGLTYDGDLKNIDPGCNLFNDSRERDQAQLYVILYMEQLMQATGEAVQDLVEFADSKVADGTMKKKRLIFPNKRRMNKWLMSIFKDEDSTAEETPDVLERGANVVFMGDGFGKKKDPEHLPANSAWQHFGNGLRQVSRFFGSEESAFGFRVACATMTVGIVAFLEQTQDFFIKQRLVWAMIIIAIGMTQTSGQSIFGFFCRVGGTLLAMILSFIIWYIVDEKLPGVIVILWLFLFLSYYFFIKFPRFIPGIMICIVTQVLIIGYELQVKTIGIAAAAQSGQPYYPTYELAPYRLATVAGGCLVAFFWTIFPSPLTDRTWIRRDLSAVMYLLANYFSVINETMKAMINETGGDIEVKDSPANRLRRIRQKLFGKLTLLLPSLQAHAGFQKFEPDIGGKFPRAAYEEIILRSTRIMNYLTLMSYTLTWRSRADQESPNNEWLRALKDVLNNISPTHHTILSTLTLISNSLQSGQSLPPFLPLPKPYELTKQLLKVGDGAHISSASSMVGGKPGEGPVHILDARNAQQRGYTEFAVIQVCGTLAIADIEGLVAAVKSLVGVVDFSFRVDTSESSVESMGDDSQFTEDGKGKGKVD